MAWLSTVHASFPDLLDRFGSGKTPVEETELSDDEIQLSQALYTFLVQYCPESTMNVIGQGTTGTNGFEVWRRLVKMSEPSYRTKAWVWRRHLSNPNFPNDITQWSSALHQWESELREFEKQFKTPFSEDEKVSILAHVSPKELQQTLWIPTRRLETTSSSISLPRTCGRDRKDPVLELRRLPTKLINHVKMDQHPWTSVRCRTTTTKEKGEKDVIRKVEKGKTTKENPKASTTSRARTTGIQDDWQKKGGKGQYYQQYQKQDKGKGKGQNAKGKQDNGKGKGNVSNPHAGKQCHVCKKHGHIAADCWWKGSVENAEQFDPDNKGSTGGSGGVGAIAGDVIFTINNVQQHVSACSSDPSHVSLLVDSGACECVARKGEFESPVDSRLAKPLFSVQGTPLQVYGKQYPEVQVGSMRGQVEMTVTDAAESLVSVHSLVSKGYDVNFSSQGCFVDTGHEKIPLEMHGQPIYG